MPDCLTTPQGTELCLLWSQTQDLSRLAREALVHLLSKQCPALTADSCDVGAFGDGGLFWSCRSAPALPISLSHTSPDLAAAMLDPKATYLGIGLDCEWADRPTRPDIGRWMGDDDQARLTLLERWSVKEAIFKAAQARYQHVFQKDIVPFKQMQLIQTASDTGEFSIATPAGPQWQGQWQLLQRSIAGRVLIIACAYLKAADARA